MPGDSGASTTSKKMYGRIAAELCRELKRSKLLPAYNYEGMREVIKEIDELWKHINRTIEVAKESSGHRTIDLRQPQHQAALQFHVQAIYRDKRCALAYLYNRCFRLTDVYWETSSSVVNEQLKPLLSTEEQKFYEGYAENMAELMDDSDIFFNRDFEPPKSTLWRVRVLREYGGLQTERGAVVLKPQTYHYLPKHDCDLLIKQGIVEMAVE